jgi:hypothetical protein
MGEPRIDRNLRIGRFLLEDILRSFGSAQWFLSNITNFAQMSEPLLAEIMACLVHVGAAQLQVEKRGGSVYYWQNASEHPGLYRSRIHDLLTRSEAETLINDVCERAEKLNGDSGHEFSYHNIYLFGSCLTDKMNPSDVDLGIEIHYREAAEIPEPSYYPFRSPETFDIAADHLCPRGAKKKLSLHDRRELEAIKAPNQLIWTKGVGRIQGPVLTPVRSFEEEASKKDTLDAYKKEQAKIDLFVKRVRAVTEWPKPPLLKLDHVRDITRDKWIALQKDDLVLAFGHLLSLPEGNLREELAKELANVKVNKTKLNRARAWAEVYVKAGIRFNPWTLRTNGRLLKTSLVRMDRKVR